MNIVIKKTNRFDEAHNIAKSLPHYFNQLGLSHIKEDTKTHILYGAFVDTKMVGFITYKEINPEVIEISWLAILPEYQGKKIGSQLIRQSLKEVGKKYKICEVKTLSDIHSDKGYARTRKFYKTLGFIPLETIHPYPGWDDKNPCQIFIKWLRS